MRQKTKHLLFACFAFLSASIYPVAIIGNAKAPKGGSLVIGTSAYPKSLFFYLAHDIPSFQINGLILEPLIDMDLKTYEIVPALASSWAVSKDKKLFTFNLNKAAKFSDGKPVTAHDVKFTWDALLDTKNQTQPFQSQLSSFESCTVIDTHTVQFKAKTLHFKNLEKFALVPLLILPKHFFSEGNFNKAFNNKLLGSGPYTLDEVKQGEKVSLKRNPNYWGANLPQNVGRFNFDKIVYKTIGDLNVQLEILKKGDIDFSLIMMAKMWETEMNDAVFEKKYIQKTRVETKQPSGLSGVTWNLRKPLFHDKRVRLALAHLMNREKWMKELFYNSYKISSGVIGLTSEYHSPNVTGVPYDPKRAKALLKEAGWSDIDSDGVLKKENARFEFDLLIDNPASQRWLTPYQEDLKTMGIKMNIRTVDWPTALKLTSDWQFDARLMARTADVHPGDFASLWGSKEADTKGSSNTPGYKNPEVDALATKIDETLEKAARIPLVRKLDEIVSGDHPMAFTWESTHFRIAFWNKFSFPDKEGFPYSDYWNVYHYWWWDAEKDKKLKQARSEGVAIH